VGTPPRGGNFPRRNRIISGLALGVLVVEASERSGALGTARRAAEQGREVFAVPGPIHAPQSRGPHRLIREGAKLVEDLRDVAEELPFGGTVPSAGSSPGDGTGTELGEEARRVLEAVGHSPSSPDQVAEDCGLTPDRVSAILLDLEIEGFIAAEPGGFYTRLPDGNKGP
jgi:DNA processing protein